MPPNEGQHERDDQRDEGNAKAAELGDRVEEGHHRERDEVARHEETDDMCEQDEDATDPQVLSSQGHAQGCDRIESKDSWVERVRCELPDAGQRKDSRADRAVHGKWWESANPFYESAGLPHGRTLRRRSPWIITLQGRGVTPEGLQSSGRGWVRARTSRGWAIGLDVRRYVDVRRHRRTRSLPSRDGLAWARWGSYVGARPFAMIAALANVPDIVVCFRCRTSGRDLLQAFVPPLGLRARDRGSARSSTRGGGRRGQRNGRGEQGGTRRHRSNP